VVCRAIIFDLDGTLADTLTDIANAVNTALADFGFPGHPVQSYRQMVGNGTIKLIERALPDEKRDFVDKIFAAAQGHYSRNCLKNIRLYDGIEETVSELRDKGIRLAVLTNKNQDIAERLVKHFFGGKVFEYIVGSQAGEPVKPDGKATQEIMQSMGLKPGDFIFVGDSGVDIDTAAAAGIRSVGVSWGFRGCDELVSHKADIIIDHPKELLNVVT